MYKNIFYVVQGGFRPENKNFVRHIFSVCYVSFHGKNIDQIKK